MARVALSPRQGFGAILAFGSVEGLKPKIEVCFVKKVRLTFPSGKITVTFFHKTQRKPSSETLPRTKCNANLAPESACVVHTAQGFFVSLFEHPYTIIEILCNIYYDILLKPKSDSEAIF